MSQDEQRPSQAGAWAAVLVLVFVLYVLSWGPVYMIFYKIYGTTSPLPTPWLNRFYAPVNWVCDETRLKRPMLEYFNWCAERMHVLQVTP